MAISVLGILLFDSWLGTCAFDGCPTTAEIQRFRPDEGGKILDRNGKFLGRLAYVRRVNVPLSQVPKHVRQAFIATEDRRFYDHNGVDWRGFLRAIAANVKSAGVAQGFSTITMQAARNTFVVGRFKARSLAQKLVELRVARLMERTLTKDQILEIYLNAIYLGNGVYGIEAASRDLFGRPTKSLNVSQGAMLAALPKAPSAYTPRRHPKRAVERRNLVLSLMVRDGYISSGNADRAKREPLRITKNEWKPAGDMDSFALDAVRALADSILKSREEDVADITVYSTLDYAAQRAADRAVQRRAASIGRSIQGAMVAMDPRNGDIRALVGGRFYEAGNFNRALSAKRQPGSAFKPFVYATALAAGYTPASEVDDDPVDVIRGRNVWSPANFNGEYLGKVTFRRALMSSLNAATVRVSMVVGIDRIIDQAHKQGITSAIDPQPAIVLGAVDVTPMEMVRAYAPFANGGFKVAPRLVRRIEASDGSVMWSSESTPLERVMDPRDAYQMTSMLRSVIDYGTGRVIREYGVKGPVAGKTGTTNNGADVWFMGYTPTVVAGFWFGYDNPRSIGRDASGGRLAAPAWAEWYMNGWKEANPQAAWGAPEGMSPRTIDAQTGYLATEWCPVRQVEYFRPGTEPNMPCPNHGPGYMEDGPAQTWADETNWAEDLSKKVGKALGKIFRF
ncbi:MAG: PBP1A family penicillin-binding protein [Gemmatimonadaceae bacterium]|nr:PBP1A family penicillin-binding protein [Gemmatimonadaceae bacterium]